MPNNTIETAEQEVFIFPTSFAQRRLWFLDQFEPGSPFYNIPTAVRIRGDLDVDALADTIDEIVFRQESLRTTFDSENGEPVQVIHPEMACPLKVVDLSGLADKERDKEALRLANNEARTPFDLKAGPLFRSTLLVLGSNEYMMLVTMHHIISDGWSVGIFMREVAAIYDAFSRNQDSPLPELEIQYADFTNWQREWLKDDVLEKQLNYWKEKLGANVPVLELPTDKPRPAVQSSRGATLMLHIPEEIKEAQLQLSRKEGITPFMSYLTAFYMLLQRWSSQEDICVGTPIANRTQRETEAIIGFFVNTLVLRNDLSGDPSFRELGQRIRKMTLEAYAHQDLPFEMLVETVQPERSMSHSPLFQVMFILQNATGGGAAQQGGNGQSDIIMEQVQVDAGTSTFDLTISLSEQNDGISASLEFCTDLFEKETMERFLRQYREMLRQTAAHPDTALSAIDFLDEDEKNKILVEWNSTDAQYDHHICMHTLVQAHAARQPESIAVAYRGTYLSYAELNSRANRLARYLRDKGVGLEIPVGVVLEKSLDLMVAVLAVLKSGGGYVPMDPDYPQDRLAHMISDSATPILITREELLPRLPENNAGIICLDKEEKHISSYDSSNPEPVSGPHNMAYMIYTSGTTGQAKGTIISHKSWVNSYFAWESAYELKTRCRSHLQMANFSFDVFAGDTIRALGSGGKMTLIPRDILLNAGQLYEQMLKEKVTIAEFVPAVLRNLVAHLDEIGKDLSFMRCLIAGSDAWYVGEYQQFLDYCGPDTRLINSFGLTEASIDTTYFEAAGLNLPKDRLVPIGRVFSKMSIYIVDANLRPQPIGVPGEICVGGEGVARGYHKRPSLTAEKFIPNPFAAQTGGRMYRTGDRGRFLNDGNIEFLGRMDHQVKLRGFRIELGEIESSLGRHKQVEQCAVIVREDTPGDKRLVAYFVPEDPQQQPDRMELRRFLLEKLPDYMVPNAFVTIDKIPLTPNGKVDRKALPQPDASAFGSEAEYVAPRSDDEKKLAGIYAEVLKLEKVGVTSNFFDLGGHSLLATQLVSRIRDAFDMDIPLRNIFEFPTIAALAERLEIARRGQTGVQAPPIMAVSRRQQLPLSFSQQRLWFLEQLAPGTANYNIPEAARIRGTLDRAILQRCLDTIIGRHENLRTNFENNNGQPRLVIHDERQLPIEYFDLRDIAKTGREEKAMEIAHSFARTVFNLAEGPLMRAGLVQLDDQEFFFLLTSHHIISDDWSTQVFIRELAVLYDAYSNDEKPALPPLPVQYADFAHWQQNWLSGDILDAQLNYWKETLSETPAVLELPTDKPRPRVQSINGDYKTFYLTPEQSERISRFTRDHGATMFMTLIAVFEALLYRYSAQKRFNVGTPIANRNRAEVEPLIGFFVNTLVMNADLSGEPTFLELLQRVRETALGAYAHQDLPFEKIVDALHLERDLSRSPLFQVMFVLQSAAPADSSRDDRESELEISPIESHMGTSKFDLTLFMVDNGKQLSGALEYNTDLFEEETITRLLQHFERLLMAVVSQPHTRIDAISLTTPAETDAFLQTLNHSWQPRPLPFAHVVEMLARHAKTYAENTALVFGDDEISYAELNRRANRLAHFLLANGAGPDTLIGLCFERHPQMVVALLAVLKAGAAYVPLDPAYPQERLAYMIGDSAMKLLLAHNATATKLPGAQNVSLLNVDDLNEKLEKQPDSNPDVAIDAQHLAYMIYTSGSTGRPKGTMISHGGLLHYLSWTKQAYPLDEGRGSLLHSTIAFDATVTALYTPLLSGKSITLAAADDDLQALGNTLVKHGDFNVVKITPAHLDLLSHQLEAAQAAGLTHAFVIGGENLDAAQIAFWRKHAPQTHLFNEYGPTETVVGCVVFDARGWDGAGSVPIGRAIPGSPVYILDARMQPLPPGVPGELYIGGNGVARGYHGRAALTADRFLPDPFSGQPGARMYKTGDLVRWLNSGQLIFLGRIDEQVKIRGYRIELGEIETALAELKGVRDSVVMVREDVPGDKRLVGYVVADDGEKLNAGNLRHTLKKSLPEYMVPAAIVEIDAVPLTANGKVDRRALPKPELDRDALQAGYVAPQSDDEKRMAAIWQELLGHEKIGLNDNFFEMGGHSLLATQLMARIRDRFDVELPLQELFEAPTISRLLQRLEIAGQQEQIKRPPLQPVDHGGNIPLSFSQQRLWFLDQLNPGSPNYNIPSAFRVEGTLDLEILQRVVNEIIDRHEVLRSRFESVAGKPKVIVAERIVYTIPVQDLSTLSSAEQEERVRKLAGRDAVTPFELDKAPLFRVRVFKLGAREYVILLNMHHIISDGWSTSVMLREIAVLYDAFLNGRTSPLDPLPVQYSDYAAWQRSWLKDDILRQQLDFWKEKLGEDPPPLDMPTDFPRPPVQTFNGAVVSAALDKELFAKVNEISGRHKATPFMALLAAWQVLLYKYSGQDDIYVGSPIANRTHSETEALIGFFVNTLVLRASLDGAMTFEEIVQQVRAFTLGAYAHQDVPFEQLVDELTTERSMSRSPLFQVMFVLQNQDNRNGVELPSLQIKPLGADAQTAKFDLTLMIIDSGEGFYAELEYNTDLFRKETAQRLLKHYRQLLANLLENAAVPLGQIVLTDDEEKKQVTRAWNETDQKYPSDVCVHAWFEQVAKKYATKEALAFGDQSLTFAELNKAANRLAHFLLQNGVTPESYVGISLQRSPHMVIALLAVLKAGAVYVPIDPAYPQERIRYILDDAGMTLLLTDGSIEAPAAVETVNLPELDTSDLPQENPRVTISPENLAYMIYTSGSTGRPKGTMVRHRGLCNLSAFQIRDFELDDTCRCLQFASFSFDASVSEIFTTLLSGATLILGSKDQLMPGPGLVRLLKDQAVTTVTLPPSVSSVLRDEEFPGLRVLVSAGEALPPELANHWHKGRRLLNAYGPTENTVCASSFVVEKDIQDSAVPIGRPIANVQLYIVDAFLNPLPAGVPGELCVAGDSLARGYHNRPDLTAEKFVPNPFSETPGARMYRSGDRARWLADGTLEFLGRIDEQVKLRGFRIEPGEIEHVLRDDETVQDALVMVREDRPGNPLLCAYLIAQGKASAENLEALCRRRLSDYMVPQAYVFIDAFPLTPNGKIDKRALPAPQRDRDRSRAEFVAPRNEAEEKLAAIWRDVLGLEKIGIYDSFFELGGHSLLATQVISRIRSEMDAALELRQLFEQPTIAALMPQIELAAAQTRQSEPIPKADRGKPLALSYAQQRLFFLDHLTPDNPTYNMPSALRLKGPLDHEAFREALDRLVERHESLRTTFTMEEGEPRQVIQQIAQADLDEVDLTHLAEQEREQEARELAQDDALQPFNLEEGPLFRARLIRLHEDDHILLFNMHHIISDGWSVTVLIREFSMLYDAISQGADVQLGPLEVQYADFAQWQRGWLSGEELQRQTQYWKKEIGINPEPLELPLDHPRPAVQTTNGASSEIHIDAGIANRLKEISRENGATLYMTLLAAFQALLHKYSAQENVLVGSPIANRTRKETENIIGFFVNTLVLKARFDEDPAFKELIGQVRRNTLNAYAHQDLPFEQLVETLQPERDMSHSPVFQTMFVWQNTPGISNATGFGDLTIEALEAESKTAKYDLSLIMMEDGEGLLAEFEYNSDLFEPATIRRMQRHFNALLSWICENRERPLSRFELAGNEDQKQIAAWNDTTVALPRVESVIGLFEQRVKQTPKATAIVFEKEKLSFDALNRKANVLAWSLKDQGVAAETLVGISLKRSPQMVIALLAVMKAGGVYVPIDPDYPAERKRYIIDDAGIKLLLGDDTIAQKDVPGNIKILNILDNNEVGRKENPPAEQKAESLAYMIYTSGSTGRPKGTMVTHKGLVNLTQEQIKDFHLDEKSRCLQFASFSFDASVSEIFTTLVSGATLYLLPREAILSGSGLVKILKDEKITTITLPPSLLTVLRDEQLPHLTSLVSAGEALPADLARHWSKGRHMLNAYGPTENTVCASRFFIGDRFDGKRVPVGRPIGNVQLYVVDEALNLLPAGVAGELCIAGSSLARGYHKRPALTAERFVPNPFSNKTGARMYRTGDRARYLTDGNIEFLGRVDRQLKIRGFRIEPGEIESRLRQMDGVREAVVNTIKAGSESLLAAWITTDGKAKDETEIRKILSEELPDYMVPVAITRLEEIPLTANGKVDFGALPQPKQTQAEVERIAPRTPLEGRLLDIWKKALGVKDAGVRDNFFEMGGHSLMAMKLMNEVEKSFDKDVTLVTFFKEPTVEGLARAIEQDMPDDSGVMLIPLAKGDKDKAPVFFIHPSGGAVHHYKELAGLIETDQPVYGIQAQGLDGKMPLHTSIEEMASAYISAIRRIQPEGPYFIGSWSFGVIISYEMARQLESMGEKTAALIQLDQGPFIYHKRPEDTAAMLADMFKRYFKVDVEQLRTLEEEEQFRTVLKKARRAKVIPRFVRLNDFRRYITVNETQLTAWKDYQHKPYSGELLLFRSGENANHRDGDDLGWGRIMKGDIKIIDVPGDHISMIREPQVKDLASEINAILEKILKAESSDQS